MKSQREEKIINGVNVTKLGDTIKAVKSDPELADFKFRAKNQWVDGGYNKITIDDFYGQKETKRHKNTFHLEADEPEALLSEDKGVNPVEYLLAGLSACMTTTLAYYAAAEGLTLEEVKSEYEGDIDLNGFLGIREDVPRGYQEIREKFKVKGDATEEQIKDIVQNSPVYDSLRRPVRIKIDVEKE